MAGRVNLQRTKVEQGRSEIFFHLIRFFPLFFNCRNQRAAVNNGNFETFHWAKIRKQVKEEIEAEFLPYFAGTLYMI
jgi:hypothetical protein